MLYKGIIPPVVTPLISNHQLDEQGLEYLIHHQLEAGVHGIFLLGTTGEGTNLSYSLRAQLVERACRIIDGKVPVLAAITDTSFEDSVRMAEIFKNAGINLLVLAPPYYNPISQKQFLDYLNDLVPRLPLPFFLYNIPSHTKMHLTVETFLAAMELGASGIKDSSGDMLFMLSLIEAFKDSSEFTILSGSELIISETIMCGGHGAVPGGANVFPRLYVDFYNAVLNRNYEKMEFLQKIILKINNTLYRFGHFPSGIVLGIKSALNILGICNDYAAPPFYRYDSKIRNEIKVFIESINNSAGTD